MRTYRTPGIYFEQKDAAQPVVGPLRTDVAGFVGLAVRGPLHKPVRIESLTQFTNVFGGPMAQGYLAYAVQSFFGNGGATCWVVRVADPDKAAVATREVGIGSSTALTISAGSPGSWGNGILARWITHSGTMVSLTLHYPDGSEELIRNPTEVLQRRDIEREELPANLIAPRIVLEPSEDASMIPLTAGAAYLAGGADGLATLDLAHVTGEDAPAGKRWGLATLELVDEVSMVAIPDLMPKLRVAPAATKVPKPDCRVLVEDRQSCLSGQAGSGRAGSGQAGSPVLHQARPEFPPDLDLAAAQSALVRHCERLQYRIAILDALETIQPQDAAKETAPFRASSFAALYYPWILVDDPLKLTGLVRSVPPSGAVAGIYARSDRLYGVHKPPANEVVQGALNVRFAVDDIQHGELNDAGVNVLRSYPGRGIRVYGARTTSSDTTWRYVNVRRLISMIEKAIDKATQWIVFEPNTAMLRREVDRVVRSFLESLFRKGMLDGASSDRAYSVQCDDATTPQEEIDNGRVICHVGVQPPPPAEFVIVVIGKTQNAMEILAEGGAIDG